MGVWANGPRPDRIDIPGIAEAMRPTLEEWMTGHLKFYDPGRENTTAFDPFTGAGGEAPNNLVLDTGANGALIQPLRSPSRVDVGAQPNGVLGIRFQVKQSVTAGIELRGGLLIQVIDGGNSQIPDTWRFSLSEAVDTSLMWDRIFDATLITGGV